VFRLASCGILGSLHFGKTRTQRRCAENHRLQQAAGKLRRNRHDEPTAKAGNRQFEELAYSNMLQVQALVELLEEKGLLARLEVLEPVKHLQAETAGKRRTH